MSKMMRAAVFVAPGRIRLEGRPVPEPGPLDALVSITTELFAAQRDGVLKVSIQPLPRWAGVRNEDKERAK